MRLDSRRRSRFFLSLLLALGLIAIVVLSARPVRDPVLRTVGGMLVAEDVMEAADLVVVSLDSGAAGALEAADLVTAGFASRVAVFRGPPSPEDRELIRRGLPADDMTTRQSRWLRMLGVQDVPEIPQPDTGTLGESQALPRWLHEHQIRSVVFVTSADHSRRVRRSLARAMQGHPVQVRVRAARYSEFDPDSWWETRAGTRIAVIELQKLALDVITHPPGF